MAKDLKNKNDDNAKSISVADVQHFGDKLIIPERMRIPQAIELLQRREQYMQEVVSCNATFDAFPQDGAVALDEVLTETFGWAPAEGTPTMWGTNPPELITVQTGLNEHRQVAWGRFSIPGVEGWLGTGAMWKRNRLQFQLVANVKRSGERMINEIFDKVREHLKVNSIYRGQAIKIRFLDDGGDVLGQPEPIFMDTSDISREQLIYSDDVTASLETNLFAPIERVADCEANGIPVKRGVLLGGTFGTGKTLAAKLASHLAVKNGLTYIYIPRADELSYALEFAMQYQSPAAVVFCEDIDRAMDGERSVQMDDILNIIDGVDSKNAKIITVLTTNNLEGINPAMLRPGRLDAVLEILPPDAKAVQQLVRFYGGEAVEADTDLTLVGEQLSGAIPAIIAEVVKRAKLAQLRLQEPGTKVTKLSAEALYNAADTMSNQLRLLYPEPKDVKPTIERLLTEAVQTGFNGTIEHVHSTAKQVKELHQHIM